MTRYRLSVSLILMMLITPITSAFGHCPVMVKPLAGQLILNTIDNQTTPFAYHSDHSSTQDQTSNITDRTNEHCHNHNCSSITVSSLISIAHLDTTYLFLNFPSISPDSTLFAPGIRPPSWFLSKSFSAPVVYATNTAKHDFSFSN